MTAYNVVRFRVKPGQEEHFIAAHRDARAAFKGFRGGALIKTGDNTFCIIGEWSSFEKLAAARPQMIDLLELLPRRPRRPRQRPRRHRSGVGRTRAQARDPEAGQEEGEIEKGQAQKATLAHNTLILRPGPTLASQEHFR